jgi:hypothetical protein
MIAMAMGNSRETATQWKKAIFFNILFPLEHVHLAVVGEGSKLLTTAEREVAPSNYPRHQNAAPAAMIWWGGLGRTMLMGGQDMALKAAACRGECLLAVFVSGVNQFRTLS